ncbi:DNA replication licensing factor MCM7 [Culex quinquefasciatus]|uniref:DNA replication licensing factor MCM7 n=1 Tax=Culex quinquefasciatus TaxID=7176 RepID=B0W6X8_CULQU|nr:DNA replication licensing factor MCM7 [Culex quinquefasciatus]|eukprot:XP_001844462.1 DNA replication licensing factor MCM7 [Culex quinquefasciatus]
MPVASYSFDRCDAAMYNKVRWKSYLPTIDCPAEDYRVHKSDAKIMNFKEIKIQEHSDQVPVGHIPRSVTVMCHGDRPGDHVVFSGIFLPIHQSGFKVMVSELREEDFPATAASKHVGQGLRAGAGVGRSKQDGQDFGRDEALHDLEPQVGKSGQKYACI